MCTTIEVIGMDKIVRFIQRTTLTDLGFIAALVCFFGSTHCLQPTN